MEEGGSFWRIVRTPKDKKGGSFTLDRRNWILYRSNENVEAVGNFLREVLEGNPVEDSNDELEEKVMGVYNQNSSSLRSPNNPDYRCWSHECHKAE